MDLELLKGHWNNWAWIIVVYLDELCTFVPDIAWHHVTWRRCNRQECERAIAAWRWDFVQRKANKHEVGFELFSWGGFTAKRGQKKIVSQIAMYIFFNVSFESFQPGYHYPVHRRFIFLFVLFENIGERAREKENKEHTSFFFFPHHYPLALAVTRARRTLKRK